MEQQSNGKAMEIKYNMKENQRKWKAKRKKARRYERNEKQNWRKHNVDDNQMGGNQCEGKTKVKKIKGNEKQIPVTVKIWKNKGKETYTEWK